MGSEKSRDSNLRKRNKTEFGDFQTPAWLARDVCRTLLLAGFRPKSLLDPTCGIGNLLHAGAKTFDSVSHLFGMDLNGEHVENARKRLASEAGSVDSNIRQGDFFTSDWISFLRTMPEPLLILGNPPWITNTKLSTLKSENLPPKANHFGQIGIDALTGASNFDISEWMLLQMISWLDKRPGAIAMLCKMKVARKVLQNSWSQQDRPARCQLWRINAKRAFDASVEACLFLYDTTESQDKPQCAVYDSLHAQRPSTVIGQKDGRMVSDLSAFARWRHLLSIEHEQPLYEWRSGVKHDCAKVMELRIADGGFINRLGDVWKLEPDFVYPMYKSTEIAHVPVPPPQRWMLVTQKSVGESTASIQLEAPTTWRYLQRYSDELDSRRSSIYRRRPRFSIFGVGEYTFASWKVAISGMHKRLGFVVVGPFQDKPIVFDDTCYFISCSSKEEAKLVARILNAEPSREFLSSLVFWNDKRPITAKLLRSLDVLKVARELQKDEQLLAFSRLRQIESTQPQAHQPRLLENKKPYRPEEMG